MARTARDLITDAARVAGIIDPSETLDSSESVTSLQELNNIIEEWSLSEYYPYSNNRYTVQASDTITIGKEQLYTEGVTDLGDITATVQLSSEYSGSGDCNFLDVDINGLYYIPNTSTLYTGDLLHEASGANVVFLNGTLAGWNSINVPANEDLVLTNYAGSVAFDASEGIYTSVTIFDNRPDTIVAVAYDDTLSTYWPLQYLKQDDFWNIARTNIAVTAPAYYTYITDYPIATIQLYPAVNSQQFQVVSKTVSTAYTLDDYIELPHGYYSAIQYELAKRIAITYGYIDKLPALSSLAFSAISKIKSHNANSRLLKVKGIGRRNQWNGLSGRYN